MYDINIFPPIFKQTYQPAFCGATCKIYFNISELNNLNDIETNIVQVSMRDPKTNKNVLQTHDICIKTLEYNNNQEIDLGKYYITILASDLKNTYLDTYQEGNFSSSTIKQGYYKIQLRFTEKNSETQNFNFNSETVYNSFMNHIEYFSEWSSVVLIKSIKDPGLKIKINGIEGWIDQSNQTQSNFPNDYIRIIGQNKVNGDKISKVKIKLYSANKILQESEDIFLKNQVNFQYNIQQRLESQKTYNIKIFYTTENLFTNTFQTTIVMQQYNEEDLNTLSLKPQINNQGGFIKIKILRNTDQDIIENISGHNKYYFEGDNGISFVVYKTFKGNNLITDYSDNNRVQLEQTGIIYDSPLERLFLYDIYDSAIFSSEDYIIIRRSSNKTDFLVWQELINTQIQNQVNDPIIEINWKDCTAEPGIWYKYQAIRYHFTQDNNISITAEVKTNTENLVMLDTEDIFLVGEGQQLIVKLNPAISSLTNKVAESITDTLGSKYPFVRRNGNINYRTFSLSGTISYFMDLGYNTFKGSKEDLYGNYFNLYDQYNQNNNISFYDDPIYEKHFREKVIKFLESNSIKLLRSLTEGNMLIKLSNVSFTPNVTLGRRIYDFSCTAYEIADPTAINYHKFNIINQDDIKIITETSGKEE